MKRRITPIVALALLFCAGTQNHAAAGSVTTTMPVTATVEASCTVSATGVSFGSYSGTSVSANGSVTVTCPGGIAYKTSLNAGQHFTGSASGARAMGSDAGNALTYFLYQDAAHATQWGDNDVANTYPPGASLAGAGTGVAQTLTVFGAVPASTGSLTPPAGSYSDTVTVTVTF